MKLRIIGEGGFAREVGAYASARGVDCYHEDSRTATVTDNPTIVCIGDPDTRKAAVEMLSSPVFGNRIFGRVLSPCDSEGLVICPGAVVTVNVEFGRHCIVNINATVGHDCRIGDFVTISPGAHISGNVTIGNMCYIGSGAVLREGITICDNVVIGAGAVVVRDIEKPGTYVGVPAAHTQSKCDL